MRTRPLILGTLLLSAPLAAQGECEKATECCSEKAAQVVQVQRLQPAARALPASRVQEAAPVRLADLFGAEGAAVPVALTAVDRGYLGVRLSSDEEGMRILEVIPGSGAAQAGLEAGDRILTVAGTSTSEDGVQNVLEGLEAGEKVKITYDRAGETRKAKVTLMTLADIESAEIGEDGIEEVEELAEIEWIENVEQDLAEEIAELDVVEVEDGDWFTLEESATAVADDRGYLGVSLESGGDELTILDVYTGSAAAEAGLQAGDVLVQFDGRKGGPQDQLEYLRGKKIGEKVQVRYRRGDDVGRTKITLGALASGSVSFGLAQGDETGLERVLLLPGERGGAQGGIVFDARTDGESGRYELDSEHIQELVRRALEEQGETGQWITQVSPEAETRILRGDDGQSRVRIFTTREGDQLQLEAIVEDHEHADHDDHEHEHADHDDDHDHEHGDHEEIVFGVDARGLVGGDVEQFIIRHADEDLHTHGEHEGDVQRRVVIKRIGHGEETVEEYELGGDDDDLPDHIRELLHRHAGDHGADADETAPRIRRRVALGTGEGRGGNRMIFVPEGGDAPVEVDGGGRIRWIQEAPAPPAAPRRAAARSQERMLELQQRVRQLERRIAELERALERSAERPRERRIRWDR